MDTTQSNPVKRIAVLGANGQIGSLVTSALSLAIPNIEILGCIRKISPAYTEKSSVIYLTFDPLEDNWQKLGKVDILINCIGIIHETNSCNFAQAHIGVTKQILKYRELLGNPKLIQLSVLGADDKSDISFLRTKAIADLELVNHKNTVVIRPSIVCTHNTLLVRKLNLLGKVSRFTLNCLPFPHRFLQTQIQPILAVDLAELIVQVCLQHNHFTIIEAVGPTPVSIHQLLKKLNRGKLHLISIPQGIFNAFFKLGSKMAPSILNLTQFQLLFADNTACCKGAERILGRKMQATDKFWQKELF